MTTISRHDPLVGRLDGLFNDLFRPAFSWQADAAAEPLPLRLDVSETADAYTVSAELPGVRKDEIAVEIEGNEVAISTETRRGPLKEGEKPLRVERYFGKAARRFALPQEIDEARAAAKFVDGVLELTLPKKASVSARKLEIN